MILTRSSLNIEEQFLDFSKNLCKAGICPFIETSLEKEVFSIITLDRDFSSVEFVRICILEAERIRSEVFKDGLGCMRVSNVIFSDWNPSENEPFSEINQLLDWTHWILKTTYTSESLMFGKFQKEKKEITQRLKLEINPPCNFISIREAIKKPDVKLLEDKHYSNIIQESDATEDDVFNRIYSIGVDEVKKGLTLQQLNQILDTAKSLIP